MFENNIFLKIQSTVRVYGVTTPLDVDFCHLLLCGDHSVVPTRWSLTFSESILEF